MIETVLEWFDKYQSEHPDDGLSLALSVNEENPTRRSLNIRLENDRILGNVYLWETGELDIELADMTEDKNISVNECYEYESTELGDPFQVIEHIEAFLLRVPRSYQSPT